MLRRRSPRRRSLAAILGCGSERSVVRLLGVANLKELPFRRMQFYATAPYPCSYLEGRLARSQVATTRSPHPTPTSTANSYASGSGAAASLRMTALRWRRACVPVRVRWRGFVASRSQRRARRQHSMFGRARGRACVRARALRPLFALPIDAPRRRPAWTRQPRASIHKFPLAEQSEHAPVSSRTGTRTRPHAAHGFDHRCLKRRSVVRLPILRSGRGRRQLWHLPTCCGRSSMPQTRPAVPLISDMDR